MKQYSYPSVMTIAGFDGSGGAGIQADIKTISALGCYATSALTALPVQNTTGVKSIYPIEYMAVQEQIQAIMEDIPPKAIKIGMLHTSELVLTVVETLKKYPKTPLVFDPVMVATSGHKLIEDSTIGTIVEMLFPITDILTPNLDEAAILAEMEIHTVEDMYSAGRKIKKLGVKNVLLKGGHLKTPELTSLFFDADDKVTAFQQEKYNTNNTHGSGCTLSSAIASYLALGESFVGAISKGQDYVHKAIFHGKDVAIGKGNGPLNQFFNPQILVKHDLV